MKAVTPPIFMFVGHSGSGKTAVVEKLLRELTARGLRPATIKHAHHKVKLDKEGKDSWRYKKAGAVMSMLVTSSQVQIVADALIPELAEKVERQEVQWRASMFEERQLDDVFLVIAATEDDELNQRVSSLIGAIGRFLQGITQALPGRLQVFA